MMNLRVSMFSFFFLLFTSINISFADTKHKWDIQNFDQASDFKFTIYSKSKDLFVSAEERQEVTEVLLEFWDKYAFDTDKLIQTSGDGNWQATLLRDGITPYLQIKSNLDDRVVYHFLGDAPIDKKFKAMTTYDVNPEIIEHKLLFDNISSLYAENKKLLEKAIPTTNHPLSVDGKWEYESKEKLEVVMDLYRKLLIKWDEMRKANSKMTSLEFQEKFVATNKVRIVEDGVGVAELNAIDQRPFVRVVDQKSEMVFMIADENDLIISSKHLEKYLARQHIDAGAARADHKLGRDVVLVMLNSLSPDGKINFNNPNNFSLYQTHRSLLKMSFWKDWWAATYRTPKIADIKFGVVCGLFQGFLGACIAGASYYIHPDTALALTPALVSTVWGTLIGTYISFYKNWTNRGGMFARVLKSSVNGLAFGYTLKFLVGASLGSVTTHLSILFNVIAKNRAKQEWNNFPRFREFSGMTKKPFRFKLPNGKIFESKAISQASVENQAWYTFPYVFSYLDLIDFEILGFPLGKATLIANIPLVNYAFLQYIEHVAISTGNPKALEMAKAHRIKFEKIKLFFSSSEVRGLIRKKLIARLSGMKDLVNQYNKTLESRYERSYEKIMTEKIVKFEEEQENKKLLDETKTKSGFIETVKNKCDAYLEQLSRGIIGPKPNH